MAAKFYATNQHYNFIAVTCPGDPFPLTLLFDGNRGHELDAASLAAQIADLFWAHATHEGLPLPLGPDGDEEFDDIAELPDAEVPCVALEAQSAQTTQVAFRCTRCGATGVHENLTECWPCFYGVHPVLDLEYDELLESAKDIRRQANRLLDAPRYDHAAISALMDRLDAWDLEAARHPRREHTELKAAALDLNAIWDAIVPF